jgi:hypothetical protein
MTRRKMVKIPRRPKVGRPPVLTPEKVKQLEDAFIEGATDLEACNQAGISKQTLYNFQKDCPEFIDRKEQLKSSPVFQARKTVNLQIKRGDADLAIKYLERKVKDEFAPRTEHSGPNGGAIPVQQDLTIQDLQKLTREQRKARLEELEVKRAYLTK